MDIIISSIILGIFIYVDTRENKNSLVVNWLVKILRILIVITSTIIAAIFNPIICIITFIVACRLIYI